MTTVSKTLIVGAITAALGACATTTAPPAPPVPDAPQAIQPASESPNGETVFTLAPTLKWEPARYADGYGVYVSEFNGDTWEIIYNTEADANGPIAVRQVIIPQGLLQDDGQYRWNARAWNNRGGWGPYSAPEEFVVDIRTDAELDQLITEHLERAPGVNADRIEVRVDDGAVTLAGCVPTPSQREYAHEVAHSVGGVAFATRDTLAVC